MILQMQPDGSYSEIGFIKTKFGETVDKIVNRSGEIYFEQGFTREVLGIPPFTLNAIGKPLKDYEIYGNTVQNGTPSPDSPVNVQSVGDRTNNIIPTPSTETWTKGYITATGTTSVTAKQEWTSPMIELDPTQNRISIAISIPYETTDENWIIVVFYDDDGVFISRPGGKYDKTIVAVPTNARYAKFCARFFSDTRIDEVEFMGEYGTEHTAYEPYGYKIPIVTNGKNLFSGFVKGVGIKSNSGIETQDLNSATTDYIRVFSNTTYTLSNLVDDLYSFVAFYDNNKNFINRSPIRAVYTRNLNIGDNISYIRITQLEHTDVTGVIDNIDSAMPQLEIGEISTEYEPYKTPIITDIYIKEPLRKIGDYADILRFSEWSGNLPEIPTFNENTVITINTEIQPSNMKITYKARN